MNRIEFYDGNIYTIIVGNNCIKFLMDSPTNPLLRELTTILFN